MAHTNGTQQEIIGDHIETGYVYVSVLEAALGRMWSVDDGLRLFHRWNKEIERRGGNSYYDDEYMTDEEFRGAIYQDLEYLRSNGELGPNWTEHNMDILIDDVLTLELSHGGLHTDFEVETSDGLSEETISKYLKTRSCGDARDHELICIVCQDQLYQENGTTIATLEHCGHEYHIDCIKEWLRRKNICPLCKAKALPETMMKS